MGRDGVTETGLGSGLAVEAETSAPGAKDR